MEDVVVNIPAAAVVEKQKLWNKNFFLLWQGQFVSSIGDVFFQIALGFWVLAVTNSTALMGTLMAASTIPRVLVSPFSGVIVDRVNRRVILVAMDFIRGSLVLFIAVAALTGFLEIWMVFTAGVAIGLCAAFFDPTVSSVIPDIVHPKKLLQANSVYSTIHSFSGIFGNALGGIIFSLIGAPLMFLVNGISYIFSAFSEIFIRVPKVEHQSEEFHYFSDLKDGFRFIKENKAMRLIACNAALLNFFLTVGGILFLPFFQQHAVYNASHFGVGMALLTLGSLLGFLFLSAFPVKPAAKFTLFSISILLFSIARTLLFAFNSLASIYLFAILIGFNVAIINSFISTTMQVLTPQNKRGKIFGFFGALTGGLTPLGMAVGGIVAEFIAIPHIIVVSGILTFFGFVPILLSKEIRAFINFNPEAETVSG